MDRPKPVDARRYLYKKVSFGVGVLRLGARAKLACTKGSISAL